jgi:hypothetical protein
MFSQENGSVMVAVSLWSIRIAMALLALGYTIQFGWGPHGVSPFRGGPRNSKGLAWLWVLGATLASVHIVTALHAFHSGSLAQAVDSTARRTEEMFGVRAGAGVYVNFIFVGVWWLDAAWRWKFRSNESIPVRRTIERATDFFLIAISFFGAVVFANGAIRYVGLAVIIGWIVYRADAGRMVHNRTQCNGTRTRTRKDGDDRANV